MMLWWLKSVWRLWPLLQPRALCLHGSRDDRIQVLYEVFFAQQLRPLGGVAFFVTSTEILTHERSLTVGEVAVIYLLGIVCRMLSASFRPWQYMKAVMIVQGRDMLHDIERQSAGQ